MEGRKIDHYIILKEGKKWGGGQSLELPIKLTITKVIYAIKCKTGSSK